MIKNCSIKNIRTSCTNAMGKAKGGFDTLKSMKIRNKANIDFSIKSDNKDSDIFSFRKNFDKEYKLLPIIGVALGIILILILMGMHGKDND